MLFLYSLLPLTQPCHLPPSRASPQNTPVLAALSWMRVSPPWDNPQFIAGRNFLEKAKNIIPFFFPPMKYLEVFDLSKNKFKFAISTLEVGIKSE